MRDRIVDVRAIELPGRRRDAGFEAIGRPECSHAVVRDAIG
jgi:hypothetical protein